MNRLLPSLFLIFLSLSYVKAANAKDTTKKTLIAEVYTWNLEAIYPNEAAWHTDLDNLKQRIPELKPCQGHLSDSSEELKKCLDLHFELSQKVSKLFTWAGLKQSGDVKNAKNIENEKLTEDAGATFSEADAFYSPEIAKLGREKIEKMEKKLPALAVYHQYLRVILDQTDHTLDVSKEQLLATLGPILYSSGDIQDLLLNSDIVWKSVKLSDGKTYTINQTNYQKFRESANRSDREKVFKAFYEVLSQFQHTLGSSLGTAIKRNVTLAHIRNYPNALKMCIARSSKK